MFNKIKFFLLISLVSLAVLACKEDEDPFEKQRKIDKSIINKYVKDNGLSGAFISYEVFKDSLVQGSGPRKPAPYEAVELIYTFKTLNGTSEVTDTVLYQHGHGSYPFGWEVGVNTLKVGDQSRFLIPSYVGFGDVDNTFEGVPVPKNSILDVTIKLNQITPLDYVIDAYVAFKGLAGNRSSSGMFYKIDSLGAGDYPTEGKKVFVRYDGYFIDGKRFDNNGGNPISFTIGRESEGYIKGWQQAIMMLRKGDKGKFVMPYTLAYGTAGSRSGIPPYATLVFDMEMVDIQ